MPQSHITTQANSWHPEHKQPHDSMATINLYKSKKYDRDQETIQSSTPPRIPHGKVTKNTINITNNSQVVSPFPAGYFRAVHAILRIGLLRALNESLGRLLD